jgi:hypothetical protein
MVNPYKDSHCWPGRPGRDRQVGPRVYAPFGWTPDDGGSQWIGPASWIQPQLALKVFLRDGSPTDVGLVSHPGRHRYLLVYTSREGHTVRQHPQGWSTPIGVISRSKAEIAGQDKVPPARGYLVARLALPVVYECIKPAVLCQVSLFLAGIASSCTQGPECWPQCESENQQSETYKAT